ncbi:spore coat U domain-containing protein [Ignatzschineria sp. RMDPL8A]|uniref:Csu type fimbrial protein n=1 Tax=Ignatzschineria sp. RMDPL8A TaxID=2999236 RepID=UPI0024466155|nr:spore coat U domain-containing protein [Ignatzschineria sp. RMDPL8A]MDG9729760.1 spore coat U domain-containing protein [Ignatzschineria sp. RMDPL8A]
MSMSKYILKWAFAVILFMILGISMGNIAWAKKGCQITNAMPTINLGSETSFNIINKAKTSHTENAGVFCEIPKLTASFATQELYATASYESGGVSYLSKKGGDVADKIDYKLYFDKSMSSKYEVHHGVRLDLKQFSWVIGGKEDLQYPAYVSIFPQNVNLSAGLYSDTVTVLWEWDICLMGTDLWCLSSDKNKGTSTIAINLIVTEDCKISASDINFGSAPVTAAFSDVDGTINIICTKGTFYSAGLSKGDNFSGSRRMKSGSNFIDYEIYKGNQAHEVWGNQGSERRDSASADENPGAGWGGTKAQRFNYRAKILPNQPNKPAGTYIDHIMIDVEF